MATTEVESVEGGDPERGEEATARVLVTYRVRICTRCKHAACQYCNGSWCDSCLDTPDKIDKIERSLTYSQECADECACVYEEPEDQAVVEIARHVLTAEEVRAYGED